MLDTQDGQEPGEGITPSAMPTEDQPAEVASQTPNEDSTPQEGLPPEVSDRTKAEFDKLKAHNIEMAEKLKIYEQQPKPKSVLEELYPTQEFSEPVIPVQGEQTNEELLVDKDGYIDVTLLNKRLKDAEDRSKRAEDKAKASEQKATNYELSQKTIQTHQAFPQLDPNSPLFDPNFHHIVKLEMVNQMMNGKDDFMEAAKAASKLYQLKPTQATEDPIKRPEPQNQTVTQRAQINATASGQRAQPVTAERQQELIKQTLKGNSDALYERLKASGY